MSVATEKADLTLKYIAHYKEAKDLISEGSADVLNEAREKAFRHFVEQGIPTRRNENYKYTNLHPKFQANYKFIHSKDETLDGADEIKNCDVEGLDTLLYSVLNGWFRKNDSNELPEGIILGSLEKAAKENPGLIKKYYAKLAKSENDAMIALNTAMAKDGFFLYLPKNTSTDKPIQITNFLQSETDAFVTQRNLIVIEEGANVQLILCDHTLNQNEYLSNSVTEIVVGNNANLEYYNLQNQHNNSTSINSIAISQGRDSKVTTHTTSLHGGLIRNNLKFVLDGENAEANMFGMAFLDRKQHVDNFTQIIHANPHCSSNQVYKNVLDEASTGAFSGQIHVVRDAQKTNAFQRNNNLLLTDTANMQTKPQLIIDADDVKCSHGATIGQIDEEALFYLRARGIEESKARLMMMTAFAHEVIQEIKVKPLQKRMEDLVDKRLQGEVARCHDCDYNCDC